jgi:FAD/FMN-containing dehydrogenase
MALADTLKNIVGAGDFLDDPDILDEFSADISFVPRIRPRCVVRPNGAAEVQEIIKAATEWGTPLVPVSSGTPRFRGDTVPSMGGAVMVDLSGMKQIVRIDRRNRAAMIEAGVTFHELIPDLKKEGLRLNMPLSPRRSKSVIGSMLEREPVTMPVFQWDAQDPLLCTEVYFGTGDRFRTGSAAGPGTIEEQWKAGQAQLNPMGPGQFDVARIVQGSQGTMGVVTWASVRCEAVPTIQISYLVGRNNISQVSDFIYKLLWLRDVEHCVLINGVTTAALAAKDKSEYESLKNSLPPWVFFFSIAGYQDFPEERIDFQEERIFKAAYGFGVEPQASLNGFSASTLLEILSMASDDPYWKIRAKGACEDIFFLTTLDRTPGFVKIMTDLAVEYKINAADMGTYIQPMVQGTCCHCEFSVPYDLSSRKDAERVKNYSLAAVERLQTAGAFFSRPYGPWADMIYSNDTEVVNALRKAKQIFDPYMIMNPGKLCF